MDIYKVLIYSNFLVSLSEYVRWKNTYTQIEMLEMKRDSDRGSVRQSIGRWKETETEVV